MVAHERIHTGERPFKCKHCNLKFYFIPGNYLYHKYLTFTKCVCPFILLSVLCLSICLYQFDNFYPILSIHLFDLSISQSVLTLFCVCPSVCQYISISFVRLSYAMVILLCLLMLYWPSSSISLSFYLSISPSLCLSFVCQSICLTYVWLPICLSYAWLSIHSSVLLPNQPTVCPSLHQSVLFFIDCAKERGWGNEVPKA
jgi:hypothetical protein